MKRRIDSKQTYLIPESYWGADRKGYRHVKGSEMRRILDKERMQYLKGETERIRLMSKYHPRGKFKETEEGYEYIPPSELRYSRRQLQKIEDAKLPPGFKDLALAGLFTGSTILTVGKPVKRFFDVISGAKPKYKGDPGIHYVSWFDIIGEPLGLSPKGSTALLAKYPIHAAIGGGLAEIPIFFGIGLGVKGIQKGVTVSTKGIIAKAPTVFYKVTGKLGLPKTFSKFIYGTGKPTVGSLYRTEFGKMVGKVGTRSIRPKLMGMWQRLYSYSIGKAGFVKVFPMKGLPLIKAKGGIFAKTTTYKGFGRRVLVSAKEIGLAKERLRLGGALYGKYQPGVVFESRMFGEKITVKGLLRKTITERYLSLGKSAYASDVSGGLAYIQKVQVRPMVHGGLHHAGYLGSSVAMLPSQASVVASALSLGLGRLSIGLVGHSKVTISNLIPKDATLLQPLSIQSLSSVTPSATISQQLQRDITSQMYKMVLASQREFRSIARGRGSTPQILGFRGLKPIIIGMDEFSFTRKKPKYPSVKPLDLIPYVKEHKVVKIEKLLSMKELKL